MEPLGERPVWSMSGSEMLATLDQLDAELARLQTYRLQAIARLEEIGYAQEIGAHDTVQLLAFRYRLDRVEAHREVRLARALPKYDAVSANLPTVSPTSDGAAATGDKIGGDDADAAAGDWLLRPAQAEAIVSALERVPTHVPVEHVEVAEQQLVNLARHLSPAELRKAGKQIRDLLDTDGPEPDEHKAYAREALTLSTADNGVKFRGFLANENAELLRSLIHAGARPHKTIDGELDPRSREKRQADALTTALTIAATATETGDVLRNSRPTTQATNTRSGSTASAAGGAGADGHGAGESAGGAGADGHGAGESAGGAGADGHRAGDSAGGTGVDGSGAAAGAGVALGDELGRAGSGSPGGGSNWVPGFGAKANITVTIDLKDLKAATADATGQLVYGDGLSAAAIRRLACDAKIIPLVLGSNSEPLDVGRAERLVNRAIRRALNARDRGCVVCGAPPIQCDAHHLQSWIDGGPTSIWNLVLLCRRHHIDLHAGHWTIQIIDGVVHVARPTWADPPRRRTPRTHQTSPPSRPRPGHESSPGAADRSAESSPRGSTDVDPLAEWSVSDAACPHPSTDLSTGGAAAADPLDERASDAACVDTSGGSSTGGAAAADPLDQRASDAACLDPSTGSSTGGAANVDVSEESRVSDAAFLDPWGGSSTGGAADVEVLEESRVSDAACINPWGEPVEPVQAAPFKWHADATTREEAARFAVWGDNSTPEASDQPSLSASTAGSSQATPLDPWDAATLDTTTNATPNTEELTPS